MRSCPCPFLVLLRPDADPAPHRLGLITAASVDSVVLFAGGSNVPQTLSLDDASRLLEGSGWLIAPEFEAAKGNDDDATSFGAPGVRRRFGFRWFVPELLRHRQVWRDVLLASLALQLVVARDAALHAGDRRQSRRAPHAESR